MMIKLICSECKSDDISILDREEYEEGFICNECGEEFEFIESQWQVE